MYVTVVGCGHVGLVTATAFAAMGHEVIGIDSDVERVKQLSRGEVPFYEPGLEAEMRTHLDSDALYFTTSPKTAYEFADVVFICVGTPPRANGEANLIAVEQAARSIYRFAHPGCVVVEKSTVPCGTHERLLKILGEDIHVASNPEFLREGTALKDTLEPDRIVVGAHDEAAFRTLRGVYRILIDCGFPYIETDVATAELAKHASNSMLAARISFMNMIAFVCDRTGADVGKIAQIMGADPRIGPSFLEAGLGFGGFCFPKDVAALSHLVKQSGVRTKLLDEVLSVNRLAVESVFLKIENALWNLEGKHIAVLGLAFKPGTDDVRFSPPLELCALLLQAGADVTGWDPQAAEAAQAELPGMAIEETIDDAVRDTDAIVIATEWPEIHAADLSDLADLVRGRVIVDARNFLDDFKRHCAKANGFDVIGVGR